MLFDLRGSGNPDDFRAYESAKLATAPPPSSDAGGTAKDMRARLASYAKAPLAWPTGSPCASGTAGTGGAAGGSGGSSAGGSSGSSSGGVPQGAAGASSDERGCGCRLPARAPAGSHGVWLAAALIAAARARRRVAKTAGLRATLASVAG